MPCLTAHAHQPFLGLDVVSEQPVERQVGDIGALQIDEGAREVQQCIIGRQSPFEEMSHD
jgi:hypothetical protein